MSEYRREEGAYVVSSAFHLADFERTVEYQVAHGENVAAEDGFVVVNGRKT